MNSTFKKVALASALLASSALVAPAYATDSGATGASVAYTAPYTTSLQAGYGMKVKMVGALTGVTAAERDNVKPVAFLYNAAGECVGTITGDKDTNTTDGVLTGVVTMPSASLAATIGATKVVLGFVVDQTGADDTTLFNIASSKAQNVLVLTPGATEAAGTYAKVDVAAANAYPVVSSANADLVKAGNSTNMKAAVTASGVALGSYAGPTLKSAGKDDAVSATYAKLTFDAIMGGSISTGSVGTQVVLKNGSTPLPAFVHNTKGVSGTSVYLAKDVGGGSFGGPIDTVSISASLDAGDKLEDKAGNKAQAASAMTVDVFAKPAYAASGKSILVTNVGAGVTTDTLFTAAGQKITSAANTTVTLSIRMKEAVDATKFNAPDDLVISNAKMTLPASFSNTGSRTTLTVDLRLDDGWWRFNPTTGVLQHGGTGTAASWPIDDTSGVKIAIGKGATGSELASSEFATSKLTADLAETTIVAGLTPTVPTTSSTLDNDANGVLDGVTFDFKAPLTTTLPATTGVTVTKLADPTKTATPTVSVSGNILKVVAPEATLETFLISGSQTKAANMNTGSVGNTGASAVPYQVGISSSDITYATVYNVTDGALKKIDNVTAVAPSVDGASPVILSVSYVDEQGNSPAAGQLKIVASEVLTAEDTNAGNTAGTIDLDLQQFLINGSPLTLLNLNDGVTSSTVDYITGEKTTITGDTVLIGKTGTGNGKVSANALNKPFAMSATSKSGLKDGNGNKLAGSVPSIIPGGSVYSGPKIAQAIGTRSTNAVDGNIDTVLVKFDKAVTKATSGTTTGAVIDGMFKVRALVDGANYDVSVPASKVTIGTDGYVTLDIPAPGIIGSTKLQGLWVEYDKDSSNPLNRLVSTETPAAEITESASAFSDGTNSVTKLDSGKQIVDPDFKNDADTSKVQFSANSTKLYTMEVTGSLLSNGVAASSKGTIVRADLVDMGTSLATKSGSLTVPCSCTAGNTTLALTSVTSLDDRLAEAAKLGKSSITAYAIVDLNATTGGAVGVTLAVDATAGTNSNNKKSYPVTVSIAGQVTGTAGVTGTLVREKTPALKVLDTVYQVTNDGAFRFAVGSDTAPDDAFVLVSSKLAGDKFFTGLTSPVQSFANYLPFASNVTASGTIGGQLGTIDLAKISKSSVSEVTGWQLVGFQGAIERTKNATLKAKGVDIARLLTSIRPTTGEPVTAWAFDAESTGPGADDDEAFLLLNNVTSSALQIGSASIDGIKDLDGGFALALKNPAGGFTTDSTANREISSADTNVPISTTQPFTVFYPTTGASNAFGATAGKWSLLTMDTAVAALSTWADTNKVAAVIVVGSGNAQKSWFKGSTTNTLTSLSAGDRAFVYFEGANTAFKFGR